MSFKGFGNGLKKRRISGVSGGTSVLAGAAGGRSGAVAGNRAVRLTARSIKRSNDEVSARRAITNGSTLAEVVKAKAAIRTHCADTEQLARRSQPT